MAKGRMRCWIVAMCLLAVTGCRSLPDTSETAGVTTPTGDTPTVSTPADRLTTFSVGYSREDTLNPYTTKTEVNLQLAPLLYDSLTVMDNAFTPQLSLAAAIEAPDATHLVATLHKSAKFSDGSAVTPADVTASFNRAKTSANYKELLVGVRSATADTTAGTVTFTLASPDPHARACLSFPVIKAATFTSEVGKAPLGGGLYQLTADAKGTRLTRNPYSGKKPRFSTVTLRHLPNSENLYYGLASGEITYYYDDLSSGNVPRVSGASVAVSMNSLLFLGVRSGHEALAKPAIRQALSDLLDRTAIVSGGCGGWATPGDTPFHPGWPTIKAASDTTPARNLKGAITTLQKAGYGTDKKSLELELIYPSDKASRGAVAELVRTQCESAGITVTLTPLPYGDYIKRLKNGKYDLYLGEVQLAANLSLTPLFSGRASYGVDRQGAAATAYASYRKGEKTAEEFLNVFRADRPFVPLCWRSGLAAYDRRLTTATPGCYNAYYGFAGWQ